MRTITSMNIPNVIILDLIIVITWTLPNLLLLQNTNPINTDLISTKCAKLLQLYEICSVNNKQKQKEYSIICFNTSIGFFLFIFIKIWIYKLNSEPLMSHLKSQGYTDNQTKWSLFLCSLGWILRLSDQVSLIFMLTWVDSTPNRPSKPYFCAHLGRFYAYRAK